MPLDSITVQKAVGALLKFHENQQSRKKADLFEEGDSINLQLAMRKVPDKGQANPKRVNIPHPVLDADTCRMCLFVKEDSKKAVKEALEAAPVPGLTKIITLAKLRTHYARYKEKRELCAEFDLFFCDDRILPMMPQVLGKEFFERKKLPVAVKVTRAGFGTAITKARDSTFLHLNWGSCVSVRIALTSMEPKQIVENITVGIENIVGYVPQKWKNVQAVYLKTTDSLALPLYQGIDHSLDDEQKVAEAAKEKALNDAAVAASDECAGTSAAKKGAEKGSKRKAVAAAEEEEEEEEEEVVLAPKVKAKTPKKTPSKKTVAGETKSTSKKRARKGSQ